MAVSSVQAPAGRSKGPPPTMSSRRGCVSREQNSSVVPTASPTARPRKAPSARSCMSSAVRDGTDGACAEHCLTWASWESFSMVPSWASRTRRIASSGCTPNSKYQRAEGVSRAAKPARVARFTLDAPEHSGTIARGERGHPDARRCVNVQPRCHLHAEPTQWENRVRLRIRAGSRRPKKNVHY